MTRKLIFDDRLIYQNTEQLYLTSLELRLYSFFHFADRLAKKAYANCSSTNMIKPCKIYTSNGDYYLRYVILRSGLSFLHYSNELHNNTV